MANSKLMIDMVAMTTRESDGVKIGVAPVIPGLDIGIYMVVAVTPDEREWTAIISSPDLDKALCYALTIVPTPPPAEPGAKDEQPEPQPNCPTPRTLQ